MVHPHPDAGGITRPHATLVDAGRQADPSQDGDDNCAVEVTMSSQRNELKYDRQGDEFQAQIRILVSFGSSVRAGTNPISGAGNWVNFGVSAPCPSKATLYSATYQFWVVSSTGKAHYNYTLRSATIIANCGRST